MKLIIHDLTEDILQKIYPEIAAEDIIISDCDNIQPCIGCFGCWLKTRGPVSSRMHIVRWVKTSPCAVKC